MIDVYGGGLIIVRGGRSMTMERKNVYSRSTCRGPVQERLQNNFVGVFPLPYIRPSVVQRQRQGYQSVRRHQTQQLLR